MTFNPFLPTQELIDHPELAQALKGVGRWYDDDTWLVSEDDATKYCLIGMTTKAQWGMLVTQIQILNTEADGPHDFSPIIMPATTTGLFDYRADITTARLRNRGYGSVDGSMRASAYSWRGHATGLPGDPYLLTHGLFVDCMFQVPSLSNVRHDVSIYLGQFDHLAIFNQTKGKAFSACFWGYEFYTQQQRDLFLAAMG